MSSSNRSIKSNPKVIASESLLYQNSTTSSIQAALKPSQELIKAIDNLNESIKNTREISLPLREISEAFQTSIDIVNVKEKIEKATQPLRLSLESTVSSKEFQETINLMSQIADNMVNAANTSKNIANRFKNNEYLTPMIKKELQEIEDASHNTEGSLNIFKHIQQNKPKLDRDTETKYGDTNHVFINCPFDTEYLEYFHAIVFTIYDCGFIPRCALEEDDSSEVRLDKIIKLIDACRYGVHDISRVGLDENTKLPRFNMPFELGIFMGLKSKDKKKRCLVMDSEPYRYRDSLSDIAGVDVFGYNNSASEIIKRIRKWLVSNSKRKTIPDYQTIVERYHRFDEEIKSSYGASYTTHLQEIPFIELSYIIESWLRAIR